MNLLLTAGGTQEAIDSVRYISNHATGALAKTIAETVWSVCDTIFYVHGPNALKPNIPNVECFEIHSVKDLENTMEHLFTTHTIDYTIHSMAVSDYEFNYAISDEQLAQHLTNQILKHDPKDTQSLKEILLNGLQQPGSINLDKKISSQSDHLFLALNKAHKVISSIKKWQPTTVLIGFKLLVDTTEESLVNAALKSIQNNKADYIIANDLANISKNNHPALLINSNGIQKRVDSKQEIGQLCLKLIQGGI